MGGLAGFSRLFGPIPSSDLPRIDWILRLATGAVGRPGMSAKGFKVARIRSIRVRLCCTSRDGRIREALAMLLIGRDRALAPVACGRVRRYGPLHRPRGERRSPVTTRSRPGQVNGRLDP